MRKGQKHSDGVKELLAQQRAGFPIAPETRDKISATRMANTANYDYSKNNCKAVITPVGRFNSVKAAAQAYGITIAGMSKRVRSDNFPEFTFEGETE